MKPEISIIIPVYKVAKFLPRAIDSIENQTLKSVPFEVIFAVKHTDGKEEEVIEKWAEKYPEKYRYFSFDLPLGAAYSRLKSLSIARGNYIYLMDGDDELTPDALSTLYSTMKSGDYDCVNASFYVVNKKGRISKNAFTKNVELDTKEAVNALIQDIYFRGFVWTKLFKRETFNSIPLLYLEKPTDMFDDMLLITSLLANCKKVKSIKTPVYYYHKDNSTSVMSVKRTDRTIKHIDIYMLQRYYFENYKKDLLPIFFKNKWRMWAMLIYDMSQDKKGKISKKDKQEVKAAKKLMYNKKSNLLTSERFKKLSERAILFSLDNLHDN